MERGFAFKRILIKYSRKVGSFFFGILVICISVSILFQLIVSAHKLISHPTHSKVNYRKAGTKLQNSLTFCQRLNFPPKETTLAISNLIAVHQRAKSGAQWKQIYDENNFDVADIFIWSDYKNPIQKCLTVRLSGLEAKIVHRLSNRLNDLVFLHEYKYFTGGHARQLNLQLFKANHILKLDIHQVERIEEDGVCVKNKNFDACRDEFLSHGYNLTFGCILNNMRLLTTIDLSFSLIILGFYTLFLQSSLFCASLLTFLEQKTVKSKIKLSQKDQRRD